MVRAAILVTGDEVLGGRVPERNAAYLARSLAPLGVRVVRTLVVSDTIEDISEGLGQLLALGVDLVCTSGGLGPTYDDLTMAAVAEATSRALTVDETALALVEGRSRAVALRVQVDPADLERMRRKQATLPQGATVLPPIGTAPGCVLTHQGTLIVVLPGPPYELQGMWDVALRDGPIAELVATAKSEPTRTFRLWSIFEAQLVPVLEPLGEEVLDQIGTYTREGELEIVVPPALADAVGELLAEHFGTYLFATDDRHVESLIADALVARGETLAVGESCTGGGVGARHEFDQAADLGTGRHVRKTGRAGDCREASFVRGVAPAVHAGDGDGRNLEPGHALSFSSRKLPAMCKAARERCPFCRLYSE